MNLGSSELLSGLRIKFMIKSIQTPAQLVGVSPYKGDRGVGLRFITQSLTPVEAAEWIGRLQTDDFGYLLWSPNEFSDSDIPTSPAEVGQKTPSQRLRNHLFVYWKQLGETGDFETFYRGKMEEIIGWVKKRLDD